MDMLQDLKALQGELERKNERIKELERTLGIFAAVADQFPNDPDNMMMAMKMHWFRQAKEVLDAGKTSRKPPSVAGP